MNNNRSKSSILILKGPSKYNVLREAADHTAAGLSKCGYDVTIMDLTSPDFDLKKVLDSNCDIILMLEASLFDISLKNGQPLIAALPSLCVGWIFDDIIYHYDRVVNNRFNNTVLLSVDGCADRIARSMGISSNTILPLLHGGFAAEHKWCALQEDVPYYDKPLDIVCPCTVGREPEWKVATNDIQNELAKQALSIWKLEPELSPRQSIQKAIAALRDGTDISASDFNEVLIYVTAMIRYLLRKQIIEAVAESGLKIHLIGETAANERYPDNVTVCGPMDITEVTELIAKAKVLINPFPTLYEEGAHERIFTAMINGAVCFTPGYPFLRELLGERLEYIDINDMPDAIERMREIVDNYGHYLEPILDNAEYAIMNHTWERRGVELGKMLQG